MLPIYGGLLGELPIVNGFCQFYWHPEVLLTGESVTAFLSCIFDPTKQMAQNLDETPVILANVG